MQPSANDINLCRQEEAKFCGSSLNKGNVEWTLFNPWAKYTYMYTCKYENGIIYENTKKLSFIETEN